MNTTFDVVVVGAGSTGATLAALLAERGVHTALVEKSLPACEGASAWSGGIFRQYEPDVALLALARIQPDSAVIKRTLHDCRYSSGVEIQLTSSQYSEFRRKLSEALFLSAVDRNDILSGLEMTETEDGLRLLDIRGGYSAVRKYVITLSDYVRQHAVLLDQCEVHQIELRSEGVKIIAGSRVLHTKFIVDACGAGGPFRRDPGGIYARTVPFSHIYLNRVPDRPVISFRENTYVLPLSKHVVQVGGSVRHSSASLSELTLTGHDSEDAIRQKLKLTGVDPGGFNIVKQVVAWDSWTQDGRPVIGFSSHHPRLMTVSGFNAVGFKLAAGTACIAANQLLQALGYSGMEAIPDTVSSQFSPDRFMPTGATCA